MSVRSIGLLSWLCVLVVSLDAAAEVDGSTAISEMPRHARLLLPSCHTQPFDTNDLLATLRVELLSHGTELGQSVAGAHAEPGEVALITVDAPTCDGNDIRVRLDHLGSERCAQRRLDLGDRPAEERGRVLALAIAEILRTRWVELGVPEIVEAPLEPEPPSVEAAQDAPDTDSSALRARAVNDTLHVLEAREQEAMALFRRLRLDLSVTARAFPVVQGGLFGGQVGVSIQPTGRLPLRLQLDVGYGNGGGSTGRGDVLVQTATGGLSLLYFGGSTSVRGALGLRLELGYAWVEGQPTVPGVESASFGGILFTVEAIGGVRVRIASRLLLLVDVIAGYVPISVEPRVEGRAVGGIAKAILGANVGLSIEL